MEEENFFFLIIPTIDSSTCIGKELAAGNQQSVTRLPLPKSTYSGGCGFAGTPNKIPALMEGRSCTTSETAEGADTLPSRARAITRNSYVEFGRRHSTEINSILFFQSF